MAAFGISLSEMAVSVTKMKGMPAPISSSTVTMFQGAT